MANDLEAQLEAIRKALDEAGLQDVDIREIRAELTKRAPTCPAGTRPQYESSTLPDGSVIIQLVCK